jgi:MYXO-CTERM domain-containing protein
MAAFAQDPQTDTIGAQNDNNEGSGDFKLNVLNPRFTVQLDSLEAYVDPNGGATVHFVVYEPGVNSEWSLLFDSGPVALTGGEGFHPSGPINVLLEDNLEYAVGLFLPDGEDVIYFFGDVNPQQDLGWGVVVESAFSWTGDFPFSTPEPQIDLLSGDPYRQRITVSFGEDIDGDGMGALSDCDDTDADTFWGAQEICDGKDNDCDGELSPLETEDTDADGSPSCIDCDDTNPEIFPGAQDLCNGIDNDCDGVIPPPGSCDDGITNGTGGLGTGPGGDQFADEAIVGAGCACSTSDTVPSVAILLGLAAFGLGRRRVN